MRNVRIGRVADSVVRVDFYYQEGINGEHMPTVRNISMENVTSRSSPRAMTLRGFPHHPIREVTIRNCIFDGVEAPDIIENIEHLVSENVTINRPPRPQSNTNYPKAFTLIPQRKLFRSHYSIVANLAS